MKSSIAKKITAALLLVALPITVYLVQADSECPEPICLPEILNDEQVYDDRYYYGEIALGAAYKIDDVLDFNGEASYTLNGQAGAGTVWLPAAIQHRTVVRDFDLQANQSYYGTIIKPFADGRFVTAHSETTGLAVQVYQADGKPLTGFLSVSSSWHRLVDLVILSADRFAVIWSRLQPGTTVEEFYVRTYSADGMAGAVRSIATNTAAVRQFKYTGATTSGGLISVINEGILNGPKQMRVVEFDASGGTVSNILFGDTLANSVTRLDNGDFVFIYGQGNMNTPSRLYYKKFSANGQMLNNNTAFLVAENVIPFSIGGWKVGALNNGRFFVIWQRSVSTTDFPNIEINYQLSRIEGRLFDAASNAPLTNSLILEAIVENPALSADTRHYMHEYFDVVPLDGNEFFVSWSYFRPVPSGYLNVKFARKFVQMGALVNMGPLINIGSEESNDIPQIRRWGEMTRLADKSLFSHVSSISDLQIFRITSERQLLTPRITPNVDIDVRFRVERPEAEGSTSMVYSPLRSYRYIDADIGAVGSVSYPLGFSNAAEAEVIITTDCDPCSSVELLPSIAPLAAGACGVFESVEALPIGVLSSPHTTVPVGVNDGLCYRFKAKVTNVFNNVFEYTNPGVLSVDRSTPLIAVVAQSVSFDTLNLQLQIADAASLVVARSYSLNGEAPVVFSTNNISMTLIDGVNRVVVEATDAAGNIGSREIYVNADLTPPAIVVHGITENGVYRSSDLNQLLYSLTQPLQNVVITVNGVVRNDLSGLAEGTHTLVITGTDAQGNIVTRTINFTVNNSVYALQVLSPQALNYQTNDIRIQYQTSEPARRIWFRLNGGPEREDFDLHDLADGNYDLTVYAESLNHQVVHSSISFSVTAAFPVLTVSRPLNGAVLQNNTFVVNFASDSPVTYRLGDVAGSISSGNTLSVPEDGAYTLILTATHPVSGNVVSRSISFSTDSVPLEINLRSPYSTIYPYGHIPVQYTSNKPLRRISIKLNGQPIGDVQNLALPDELGQPLPVGEYTFRFEAEDMSGQAINPVQFDFKVVTLEIVKPQPSAEVLSGTSPPVLQFEYAADGNFDDFSVAFDNGSKQLLQGPNRGPGDQIPFALNRGGHEVILRGHDDQFEVVRRSKFRIGTRNVTAGPGSIDYEFENCTAAFTDCDVTVSLKVRNTGNFDIVTPVQLHFDHVAGTEFFSQDVTVDSLAIGETATVQLQPIVASLGDIFSLVVDPNGLIAGETVADNSHSLEFQAGQITDVRPFLPEANSYMEGIAVLNPMIVNVAGSVASVELKVNGWSFVDSDASTGFEILTDMGLLSPDNNCIEVVARNNVHAVLDTRSYCFDIKKLQLQNWSGLQIPWSSLLTENSNINNGNPNTIVTNMTSASEVARRLTEAKRFVISQAASIIPAINEQGLVTYRMFVNSVPLTNRPLTQSIDLGNVSLVGGQVSVPHGHGIFAATIDTSSGVCSLDGARPIFNEPVEQSFHDNLLDDIFQDEIEALNTLPDIWPDVLDSAEGLGLTVVANYGSTVEFQGSGADVIMASADSLEEFMDKAPLAVLVDIFGPDYYLALTYDVPAQFITLTTSGTYRYGFEGDHCIVSDSDTGTFGIALDGSFNAGLNTVFNLSTGRINVGVDFDLYFNVLNVVELSIIELDVNVKLYPQRFRIPIRLNSGVALKIEGDEFLFGPAQTHYDISLNHSGDLARVSAFAELFEVVGYGHDYKADLKISALGKSDRVSGSASQTWKYSDFYSRVRVYKRRVYSLGPFKHRTTWHLNRQTIKSETSGTDYSSEDVQDFRNSIGPF